MPKEGGKEGAMVGAPNVKEEARGVAGKGVEQDRWSKQTSTCLLWWFSFLHASLFLLPLFLYCSDAHGWVE